VRSESGIEVVLCSSCECEQLLGVSVLRLLLLSIFHTKLRHCDVVGSNH
jgi:hypothetical protein